MAAVAQFPKRYTSYRACVILFEDSPKVYFTMQCPYDRVDEFLDKLLSMPSKDAFFLEVHATLADGSVDVIRGDINKAEPRGSTIIRHSAVISPGTSIAEKFSEASSRTVAAKASEVAQQTKRRNSSSMAVALPASKGTPPPVVDAAKIVEALLDDITSPPPINYDFFPVVATTTIPIEVFK